MWQKIALQVAGRKVGTKNPPASCRSKNQELKNSLQIAGRKIGAEKRPASCRSKICRKKSPCRLQEGSLGE